MKIIKKAQELQNITLKHFRDGDEIGLVPTMGALHEGHISLIDKSLKNDDITIVSIFVNPSQFGPNEDYLKYPRPIIEDLKICKRLNADYVFTPSVEEIYGNSYKTFIEVKDMQDILCGSFRKGHFKGVATIVAKLFNISRADRAYFGMKDFQQLKIIEKMTKNLNFPTKIIPCPIIREKDGLAMSSRNSYLNSDERKSAAFINKILKEAAVKFKKNSLPQTLLEAKNKLKEIPNSKLEYFQAQDLKTFEEADDNSTKAVFLTAIYIGKTRLIDNIIAEK